MTVFRCPTCCRWNSTLRPVCAHCGNKPPASDETFEEAVLNMLDHIRDRIVNGRQD